MSPIELCYFLQGFLEISNDPNQQLSAQQVQIIKDHLALVFNKVTPDRSGTELSSNSDFIAYDKIFETYKSDEITVNWAVPPHTC